MARLPMLLLAAVLCGAAEPSPPASPPAAEASITPESLAAAHELLTAMDAQATGMTMFKALRELMILNIQNQAKKPASEIAKIVDEVLMPEVELQIGGFIDILASIQASAYTIDEMHQLMAFYRSPIGQRTIELAPKIGALSFAAGQEWGQRVAMAALQKNADELRRRGVKL